MVSVTQIFRVNSYIGGFKRGLNLGNEEENEDNRV